MTRTSVAIWGPRGQCAELQAVISTLKILTPPHAFPNPATPRTKSPRHESTDIVLTSSIHFILPPTHSSLFFVVPGIFSSLDTLKKTQYRDIWGIVQYVCMLRLALESRSNQEHPSLIDYEVPHSFNLADRHELPVIYVRIQSQISRCSMRSL